MGVLPTATGTDHVEGFWPSHRAQAICCLLTFLRISQNFKRGRHPTVRVPLTSARIYIPGMGGDWRTSTVLHTVISAP